eukprot:Gb_34425 [translate_table: standard]
MEEPERKKVGERRKRVFGDNTLKHLEQLRKQARALTGEVNFEEEDMCLETTRARLSSVLKRHEQLRESLTREPERSLGERLQKEFEAARVSQEKEVCLDGEQWNDGVLATIRERVHMEADMRTLKGQTDGQQEHLFLEKITYKIGNKVVCGLEGGRIGIQYDTSFAGEHCEIYYCVLGSRSFLEKMYVSEHTVPFFLPLSEAENEFLSSNAVKFIDNVGDMLQAYVDRREQVRLLKELYGNQIGELYHSLSYDMIEFVMEDFNCKVTVSLAYDDIDSELPTRSKVLAWPILSSKTMGAGIGRQGNRSTVTRAIPSHLPYAEDALRTISLPQAYAEIGLNLQGTLRHIFPSSGALPVHSSGAE